MAPRPRPDRIAALAALDDPQRRAVFDFVARSATAISRDAAANALGVSRRVAAFHLDRLAEQGLLAVEYRRPPGRTGPGAGRPAKLYRRMAGEVAVSVPERHYDLVGGLLAAAVAESIDTGAPVKEVLDRTAYEAGRSIGAAADDVVAALEEAGYEPRREDHDGGALALGNCPFHRLAQQFTALVCGVNLQLLRGVADGAGEPHLVVLDPSPGHCCVQLTPAAS
ncbi:helix-turn-helix transcriptional regulator [Micromonospora cremea]|uniref:Predicted transcriptional regulator, ArsR family n=1 Tax=Micromonospora cremea TaxID=709881 RepID=A0A1N5ZW58_9ACTN|nr:helix-turn-helix domain-containing protein [Micromonospora cremea]SIN26024.1 Predicted transcriptional regulator, ArsR family [Micromonospora cremea]